MDTNEGALPIVCTLQPGELDRRAADLLPGLMRRAVSTTPIADGVRLEFGPGTAVAEVGRVIDAERRCCQFLRFDILIESGLGPLRLDITGPPGTADFLASLLLAARD